jgi:hypothetical protein
MSRAIAGTLKNTIINTNSIKLQAEKLTISTIPTGRSTEDKDNKGRVETTKVRRYFPMCPWQAPRLAAL